MKIKELRRIIREVIKESQLLTEAPCNGYYQTECERVGYSTCQQGGGTFECFCEGESEPWGDSCYTGIGTGIDMGGGPMTFLGKDGRRPSRPGNTPPRDRTTPPGLDGTGDDPMIGNYRKPCSVVDAHNCMLHGYASCKDTPEGGECYCEGDTEPWGPCDNGGMPTMDDYTADLFAQSPDTPNTGLIQKNRARKNMRRR